MTHSIKLDDYLDTVEKRLLYEEIENSLRKTRSKNSPWSIQYYITRGFTMKEAEVELTKKRQNRKCPTFFPSQIEFYLEKGLPHDEAIQRVKEYKFKIGRVPNYDELIAKYGTDLGNQKWEQYQANLKLREDKFIKKFPSILDGKVIRSIRSMINKKVTDPYENFISYSKVCRLLTSLSILVYGNRLDPTSKNLGRKYGKNGYAIDHKFSIYGGFYHKVDPFKIAAIDNLRLISITENSRKSQFCVIPLEEVLGYKTILDDEQLHVTTREIIKNVYS